MNILFFAGRIIYGGGEKVRNWLAKELVKAGHHVFYASPKVNEDYHNALVKAGLQGLLSIVEYPFHIKKKHPLKYCKVISNLYRDNSVDLIIIFGGSLVEQEIAKQRGVKVILSERCDPASRPFLSRLLKQIQYRVADGFVFQTPQASLCYGNRAHRLGVVIPNPIIDQLPEPQFSNLRKEIVTVGRLSPEKNQKLLINAFALFNRQYPEYKLIIYGSGPLRENLVAQVNRLGINDSVVFVSGKTNISELIKGAELFVLPSNTEGMPNALIEAMSVGLLCISTDCPIYGPRMLVDDSQNAYLVPVGDVDAMAQKMIQAIESKEVGDAIRHNSIKIRMKLEPQAIFQRWVSYINSIVS